MFKGRNLGFFYYYYYQLKIFQKVTWNDFLVWAIPNISVSHPGKNTIQRDYMNSTSSDKHMSCLSYYNRRHCKYTCIEIMTVVKL
jgi:hypothetical protein